MDAEVRVGLMGSVGVRSSARLLLLILACIVSSAGTVDAQSASIAVTVEDPTGAAATLTPSRAGR